MPLAPREELQGMRNFLVYILSQGGYPRAYPVRYFGFFYMNALFHFSENFRDYM
jgi:hypothetical protein